MLIFAGIWPTKNGKTQTCRNLLSLWKPWPMKGGDWGDSHIVVMMLVHSHVSNYFRLSCKFSSTCILYLGIIIVIIQYQHTNIEYQRSSKLECQIYINKYVIRYISIHICMSSTWCYFIRMLTMYIHENQIYLLDAAWLGTLAKHVRLPLLGQHSGWLSEGGWPPAL